MDQKFFSARNGELLYPRIDHNWQNDTYLLLLMTETLLYFCKTDEDAIFVKIWDVYITPMWRLIAT